MILPFDNLDALQRENRRDLIKSKTRFRGVLGNDAGAIYVPGFNGNRVYVRLQGSSSGTGQTVYAQTAVARVTGMPYFEYAGSPVIVQYDDDGNLVMAGSDYGRVEQSGGLSMSVLNVANPQLSYVDLTDSLILLSRPVSNATNSSTLVSVSQWLYDYHGAYHEFEGTPQVADKIDLTSYIPTAGNHRVVQLWVDTYNKSVEVTASTSQSIATAFDNTDVNECFADRYNDWIPIQSYRLADAQTSVTASSLWRDHRQFINLPSETGFPVNDTRNYRIWDNHTVVSSTARFVNKTLIAYGTLIA